MKIDNNFEFFKLAEDCPSIEQQLKDIADKNGGRLPENFSLNIEEVFKHKEINRVLIESGYLRKGDAIRKHMEVRFSGDYMKIIVDIQIHL